MLDVNSWRCLHDHVVVVFWPLRVCIRNFFSKLFFVGSLICQHFFSLLAQFYETRISPIRPKGNFSAVDWHVIFIRIIFSLVLWFYANCRPLKIQSARMRERLRPDRSLLAVIDVLTHDLAFPKRFFPVLIINSRRRLSFQWLSSFGLQNCSALDQDS